MTNDKLKEIAQIVIERITPELIEQGMQEYLLILREIRRTDPERFEALIEKPLAKNWRQSWPFWTRLSVAEAKAKGGKPARVLDGKFAKGPKS